MLSFTPKIEYAYKKTCNVLLFTIFLIYLEYYPGASNFINGTIDGYISPLQNQKQYLFCVNYHLQNFCRFPHVASGTLENMDLHKKRDYLYIFRRNI